MNLGLQNYAVVMPAEKICAEFNNNEIHALQRCGISHNCRILRGVVQSLSRHNLKISHHCHIHSPSHDITIQIKLIGISMIFNCTKIRLFIIATGQELSP
jgi:hypothetical protein